MAENKTSNVIPDTKAKGQVARLFPIHADSCKEERTTSILLATLSAVNEFGHGLLKSVGAPSGKRAQLCSYTEVTFDKHRARNGSRPDGLLVVHQGKKKTWTALVEVKVGGDELSAKQVEDYVDIARKHDIDAVITISNQYAARVDHHPVSISKTKLRKVNLYHWSWMHLLTEALLHVENNGIEDPDQAYLLGELIYFLDHPKSGVLSRLKMSKEWKEIVATAQRRALTRKTPGIDDGVAAWQELTRVISMNLSSYIGRPVNVHLPYKHVKDPGERTRHDERLLREEFLMEDAFKIPDAADHLLVQADLAGRCVSASMTLKAPGDKKRASATVTWLLRQLDKSEAPDNLIIAAKWPSRMAETRCTLASLREDKEKLLTDRDGYMPSAFQVIWFEDMGGKMAQTKVFPDAVQETAMKFYKQAGQYLNPWTPKAPKVRKSNASDSTKPAAESKPVRSAAEADRLPPVPWGTFIRPE